MSDLLKRPGTFIINRRLIEENPIGIMEVLKDVLIVCVENDFVTNSLVYKGYSPHFDLLEEGIIPPKYLLEIQGYCNKIESIRWHREKEYSEQDIKGMFEKILKELKDKRKVPSDNLERPLTDYEKTIINNLNNNYYLKPCNSVVKELKQDLIKLFNDDKFLFGCVNKLDFINNIFNQFVKDPCLFEKEKITTKDLKEFC